MSQMSGSQNSWFNDLNSRYMKYNVSIYNKIELENLGEVDFSLKLNDDIFILGDGFEEKEYNINMTPFNKIIDEIKEKFVSFLEINNNIRVSILEDDNVLLLSTYQEEEGEKEDNYMFDDCIWALYYTIRFPNLDYDGYYILSGMIGGFDETTFKDKYDMDVSIFPY